MSKRNPRYSFRGLLIEFVTYGVLVFIYFLVVLRFLGDWLMDIFNSNLVVYGFLSLALIVAQAVLLDLVTSFLVDRLRRQ